METRELRECGCGCIIEISDCVPQGLISVVSNCERHRDRKLLDTRKETR